MKKKKFFLAGILLCLTCLAGCDSCEKFDDLESLPAETQTGANTFGCYVNGELFVAQKKYGPFGAPYLGASYSPVYGLGIVAYSNIGSISIGIDSPVAIHKQVFDHISYRNTTDSYSALYQEENVGEIILTRFDTINKVVSGTFTAPINLYYWSKEKPSKTVTYITQGRFDLPLEFY